MRVIPVIYSFARSGGTLVNQLLGVHPQCLVLSEVNPAASYKPIVEQAVEWLGLVAANEASEFSRLPYSRQVMSLYDRAAEQGKSLIVRDWVTINFLPGCAGECIKPSGQLEQELYLERAGFKLLPLVISRRSAAIYRSIKQNFMHLQNLDIEIFKKTYLEYARAVSRFQKIHLEDLRANSDTTLIDILKQFNLDSGEWKSLLQEFHAFKNCTGNTTLPILTESAAAREILPPEELVSQEMAKSDTPPLLVEADRLLGYV